MKLRMYIFFIVRSTKKHRKFHKVLCSGRHGEARQSIATLLTIYAVQCHALSELFKETGGRII